MTRSALVLLLAASRAYAAPTPATCVVQGSSVTLESVTVQPAGEPAFQLGLRRVPVSAQLPTTCGAPLDLDVAGGITFHAKRDQVWLSVTREITSADGLVTAKPGAHLIDACVQGGHVIASAVTYSEDVLEGEHKPADERVTPIDVPCDALTLDVVALADEDLMGGSGEETGHVWELRGNASKIALYAEPEPNAATRVLESPSCTGCIQLREIQVKKGWVLVETSGEGVTARGWVKRAALKRIPYPSSMGRSYGCFGDHAGAGGWGESPVAGAIERDGTVRAGTTVFAGTGTGAWGVVAKATRMKVRILPGSTWAELREVPGLDGNPAGSPWLNGHVPLAAVTLSSKP